MNALHVSSNFRLQSKARAGLFAASEIATMVLVLACGYWMINQFYAEITTPPDQFTSLAKASTQHAVFDICVERDGRKLWVHRRSGPLTELDLSTGNIERTVPLHGLELLGTAYSSDGSTCVLFGSDGTVLLMRVGEEVRTQRIETLPDSFQDGALSHDGRVCLCVTQKGRALGWNLDSPDQELDYDFPNGSNIVRIGLNSRGNLLFAVRSDGSISFHNPLTGRPDGRTLRCDSGCVSAAWSGDERFLVVAGWSGHVRTFELATGRILFECSGTTDAPFGKVSVVVISADGQQIAVTTIHSNEITVWDVQSGKLAARLRGHDGLISSMQFSPQPNRLYSGSYDGTIREWNLETGSLLRIVAESDTARLSDNDE